MQLACVEGFEPVQLESGCGVAVAVLSVVKKQPTVRVCRPLGPHAAEQAEKAPVAQKVGQRCVLQGACVGGRTRSAHTASSRSALGVTSVR